MKITRLPKKKKKPKNKIILDRNTLTMIKASKSNIVDRYCRDIELEYNREIDENLNIILFIPCDFSFFA